MSWMDPSTCKYCKNPPVEGKTRCVECAKKDCAKAQEYRKLKKAAGLCTQWGCKTKARKNKTTCQKCADKKHKLTKKELKIAAIKNREYRKHNPGIASKWSRKYQRGLLSKIFKKYGNRCNNPNCGWVNVDESKGCTDERCLQIDHIYGGGNKEVKELSYSTRLLKYLEDMTGMYQLLCANCNWIKRHENNETKRSKSPQ